jgi:hypothetical protein
VALQTEIGTVVATPDGPSITRFQFVLEDGTRDEISESARWGQFVCTGTIEGLVIGVIDDIRASNEYFENAQTVKEYSKQGVPLQNIFPSKNWEMTLAAVRVLCVHYQAGEGRPVFDRCAFPPSPGAKVFLVDQDILVPFLGLDLATGVFLGSIRYQDVPAQLNLGRLLQKHLAVLAISGAGKSYFVTVLVEELLKRDTPGGRPAVVVFDVHGEYVGLANQTPPENQGFAENVQVVDGSFIQVATPSLSPPAFAVYQPNFSPPQVRELGKVIAAVRVRKQGEPFNLSDIISEIEASDAMNPKTAGALAGWLEDLDRTRLFGAAENPNLQSIVVPGKAVIFDLSKVLGLREKQMIVNYIANRLFSMRRSGDVPPFLLVVEEAHQFAPDASKSAAISKGILETYAREGRKFFASLCLITQRPVKLSTTVLSQCNTHAIFRVTNPYDLDHIKASSEAITSDTLKVISTLPVGECIIVGGATNYPLFVKVRRRYTVDPIIGQTLEGACGEWERRHPPTIGDDETAS